MIRMCYMQLYAIKLCNRDKEKKKKENMTFILSVLLLTLNSALQLIQFLVRGGT